MCHPVRYHERMLKTIAAALLLAALATGSPAPDWTLQGSDGKSYSSAQLAGRRGYVLAWFPKAFTSGCTAELESLRDAQAQLAGFDADVFMVSFDDPAKNADFAKSLKANLVLLSDTKGDVASAFDVSQLGGMYAKRWTFYVDKDGVVRFVDKNVNTATAGADIAKKLAELEFPKKSR